MQLNLLPLRGAIQRLIEIKFEKIGIEEKKVLLDILGFEVNADGMILDKETKKEHICPITEEVVFVENASILPGSKVVEL